MIADLASVSIVMVTHNRAGLREALASRCPGLLAAGAECVLVDNASNVEALPPDGWTLVRLPRNIGVGGFNVGVSAASRELVLILDDDAWADASVVRSAARVLSENADLEGVALMPRCPRTKRSEWSFAERLTPRDRWPLLGCGMLVRRERWREVGGYEEAFFLYTNDTDFALKTRSGGRRGLWFDPALWCWHENPTALDRPVRWYHWATRNRIWLAKRHVAMLGRPALIIAAVLDGLRRSRGRPRQLWAQAKGLFEGLIRPAPTLPPHLRAGWDAFVDIRRIVNGSAHTTSVTYIEGTALDDKVVDAVAEQREGPA